MRTCGGGVRVESVPGQVERSVETWVVSLDGGGAAVAVEEEAWLMVLVEGGRREMVETWVTDGEERRVARSWEPWGLLVGWERGVVAARVCNCNSTRGEDLPPFLWNPGVRRSSWKVLWSHRIDCIVVQIPRLVQSSFKSVGCSLDIGKGT